jgi:uncharacterized membrane protein YqjE
MSRPTDPVPLERPDWKEAAADFVAARMELLALEAKDAGRIAARKGLAAGIAAFCAVFIWLLLVAGLIGWISAISGMVWYGVTLLAALTHLIIAGIAVLVLRRPAEASAFPLTRNELAKDREWLRTLKDRPKH